MQGNGRKEVPAGLIGPGLGTFLVATTMIGSGIFLLPATLALIGTISILGWLVAATGAYAVGLTIAALARRTGAGFLDSIGLALGAPAGAMASLLYLLGFPLVLPAIALAVAGSIGFLLPPLTAAPWPMVVATASILAMVAMTALGGRTIARFGSLTLLLGILPILLVATAGWWHFDPGHIRAGWNMGDISDASALMTAGLLCFWAFLGLEAASVVARQMKDPERSVPIATMGGLSVVLLVYLISTTVIAGMIPTATLARSTAPFADATQLIIGPAAAGLVALAVALKALGTLGACQLSANETWLALQRQLGVGGLRYRGANWMNGLLGCLVLWLTASPSLAGQYGVLIGAVVALSLLVFALAGLALAHRSSRAERGLGIAAALFVLGLLAVQSVSVLLVAAGGILLSGLLGLAVARRQRRLAPEVPVL